MIMMTPIMLINMPALTISEMVIRPLPNTIALGGVATGIINAQDAAIVAGIINNRGLVFIATATDAKIGRIISVVAVFEVSSVKKVIPKQILIIIIIGGIPASPLNLSPINAESPVT